MQFRDKVMLVVLAITAFFASAAAAETRGYVVSSFTGASYNLDGDCAGGINMNVGDQYDLSLVAAGHSEEEVAAWAKKAEDKALVTNFSDDRVRAIRDRARINGKPVSAWVNPAAAPDPNLNMVTGKFALGFDLDGAAGPQSFEDPTTGEKGVDNQMFRAMGCFTVFRGTDTVRPVAWTSSWDIVSPAMPAWLLSISADDFQNGPATISFARAREHVELDANFNVLADNTFRIDPDKRSQASFPAVIKGGVLQITEHGYLRSVWGEEMLLTELRINKVHLRLKLNADGSLDGILGGYQPWKDSLSDGWQASMGADWVGIYYLLRKAADANPDPKTGLNQDISTAYRIEAVPAFLLDSPNLQAKAQ